MLDLKQLPDYERHLRKFELCGDGLVLPDMYIIIRLEGDELRSGEELSQVDSINPFEHRFHDCLIETAEALMLHNFRASAIYVHGNTISILMDVWNRSSERRKSRMLSVLSSYASLCFAKYSGQSLVFCAKLSELPTERHVVDYFVWRRLVAIRMFYYQTLGKVMQENGVPTEELRDCMILGVDVMHETLLSYGISVEEAPTIFRGGNLMVANAQRVIKKYDVALLGHEEYDTLLRTIFEPIKFEAVDENKKVEIVAPGKRVPRRRKLRL